MNISNLKIGTRLGLGFGVVVVLLAAVALVAITRINLINQATERILNDSFVKLTLARQIQTEVNVQSRLLRNAVIGAADPAEVREQLGKLDASLKANEEYIVKLDTMLTLPKGKELFKTLSERRDAYTAARNALVKLIRDGQSEQAGKYVSKELRAVQTPYFNAINAMEDFQESLMKKDGGEIAAGGALAVRLSAFLSLTAAIMALLIGWFITRSITVPVNRAVALAQTVAAGDLSGHVEVRSQDEIGLLLQALNDMTRSLNNIVGQVRAGSDEISTATVEVASACLLYTSPSPRDRQGLACHAGTYR